jgi:S1-C subfamily serine protease
LCLGKVQESLSRQVLRPTENRPVCWAALLACLFATFVVTAATQELADNTPGFSAVCPIVYQLDQSSSSRGYHYSFFGNGFFINDQGYLLTAAHVLENFRDGGQPYILVSRRNGPPILLQASVIATDAEHDVAILRAVSNPFASKYKVTFLPLSSEPASPGQSVIALSLHPPKQQSAHTFEVSREDRFSGEVLSYETTQLDKSALPAEIFLLSHPVNLGQSGSPVLAQNTGAVVGLVEGRWLRSSAISIAKSSAASISTPGAAVPIRYAIALLQRQSISWHTPQPKPPSPASPVRWSERP